MRIWLMFNHIFYCIINKKCYNKAQVGGDFMNFDDFKVIEIRKVEDEYKRAKLKDASAKIISIICTIVMLMNASVNNFKTDTFKNLLLFDEVALLQGVVLVLNKYKKERKLEKLYDLLGIEEEERIWSK